MNSIKFDRWGEHIEMEQKDFYDMFSEHYNTRRDWYKMSDAERAVFEYILERQEKYLSALDLSKGFTDFYNNGILKIIRTAAIDLCIENGVVKSVEEYNERYVNGGYKTFYNYGIDRLSASLKTLACAYGGWKLDNDFWNNYEKAKNGKLEQIYLPHTNVYVVREKNVQSVA